MNVMGNTIPIKHNGETLACIDPSQVMAVIPIVVKKPCNVSLMGRIDSFLWGDRTSVETVKATRIIFKDGSSVQLEMPFFDFVNTYP